MAYPVPFASPYGNVRGRALAARLWTGRDLKPLADSDTAARAADLAAGGGEAASPEAVEAALNQEFLSFGLALRRALAAVARPLLDAVLARSWVENLRALCRTCRGSGFAPVEPLPVLPGLPALPLNPRFGSVVEVAVHLPRGPWRELLSRAGAESGTEPAVLDDLLLVLYWERVARALDSLPRGWRKPAREILAGRADLDLVGLLWRERVAGRALVGLSHRSPPLGLGRLLRQRLVPTALLHRGIRRRLPGFLELLPDDPEAVDRLEVGLAAGYRKRLRRQCLAPPFGVGAGLAALFLKELEVRDIKAILGAKRFRLGTAETANLVGAEMR